MKSFKKKLSTIVLAALSCCNITNAAGNVATKPKVQDVSKKGKGMVWNIIKYGGIIFGANIITSAVDQVATGRCAWDEAAKRLASSRIEKKIKEKFMDLLSPYMDLNFFASHEKEKEYLVNKMVDVCVQYEMETDEELEDKYIFPLAMSKELDLRSLFKSSKIKNGTKLYVYLPDFDQRHIGSSILKTTSGLMLLVDTGTDINTRRVSWGGVVGAAKKPIPNGIIWYGTNDALLYGYDVLDMVGTKIASKSLDMDFSEPCICNLPGFLFIIEKDNDGNLGYGFLKKEEIKNLFE